MSAAVGHLDLGRGHLQLIVALERVEVVVPRELLLDTDRLDREEADPGHAEHVPLLHDHVRVARVVGEASEVPNLHPAPSGVNALLSKTVKPPGPRCIKVH